MAKNEFNAEKLAEAWAVDKGFDYTLTDLIEAFTLTKPEAYDVTLVLDRLKVEDMAPTH